MGVPGPFELSIILGIVVLIFGTGKLTGIGKSLGTAIHDFKSSVKPEEKEESTPAATPSPADAEKTE
ncbi:MAG: twin-arginine translocase TatA/TatE family subunit [Candidatus Hydrogenedentes bacterium]|nr:twin-arginine translocase TatA/TatE family subunit [Candidatus Hydrogenedentota bacterium]